MAEQKETEKCICRGSLYLGHAPHRNMTYILLLQTNRDKNPGEDRKGRKLGKKKGAKTPETKRDKNLGELLLDDGKNEEYKMYIDGKFEQLATKLLEEVPLCPEHADRSIFLRKEL